MLKAKGWNFSVFLLFTTDSIVKAHLFLLMRKKKRRVWPPGLNFIFIIFLHWICWLAEICPEQLRDQNCNMHCALIVLYSVVAVCLQLVFFTRKVTFKRIISSRVFTFWSQTLFSIVLFILSHLEVIWLCLKKISATGLAKYSFWAFWLDFPKIYFNFLKSFLCQSVNIHWIYLKYSYM